MKIAFPLKIFFLVLGAGAMGSAFCFPLADSGNEVRLIGTHLDEAWIAESHRSRTHPKIGISFPDSIGIYEFGYLSLLLDDSPDLLVLGVSSPGIPWAVAQIVESGARVERILLLTKGLGIVGENIRMLPEIVRDSLIKSMPEISVGGVAGPCIAGELAARRDSSVTIASTDSSLLTFLAKTIQIDYYHMHQSDDIVGTELCAALKNFYAIGVGYAAGLSERHRSINGAHTFNPAAAIFAQAIGELAYLVPILGGALRSVYGLPGVGDLYVTSQAGRNSRLGALLGSGLTFGVAKSNHM